MLEINKNISMIDWSIMDHSTSTVHSESELRQIIRLAEKIRCQLPIKVNSQIYFIIERAEKVKNNNETLLLLLKLTT